MVYHKNPYWHENYFIHILNLIKVDVFHISHTTTLDDFVAENEVTPTPFYMQEYIYYD